MKIPAANKSWLLPIILLLALAVAFRARENKLHSRGLNNLPAVILWAWERPEDLSFIDPSQTGVAFLAKTIYLSGNNVVTKPRMQPLSVPKGTRLVAVVRIETDRQQSPALSKEQLNRTVDAICAVEKLPEVSMIQIDFDAVNSERGFYRDLIVELRDRLPYQLPLSITALASWCDGDHWLSDLPLDEVVPMFFRMGVDSKRFASRIATGTDFLAAPCKSAAGVSTDEKISWPRHRRVYIFNPNPWTMSSFTTAMEARVR